MKLSVRNWLWESGVGVSYSGTSVPSNSVLLSGNTANLWKAASSGMLGFTLGAAREVGCVGLLFAGNGNHSVTAYVRSGGAGGVVVATFNLVTIAYPLGEQMQQSASSFAASVVGDYVEFDVPSGLTVFGFWAGQALTFHHVDYDFSYLDTSDIQQAANGSLHTNRCWTRREVVMTIRKVVETLSIGATPIASSFEDLQDALSWAGLFPTVLVDLIDSEVETTIFGRLAVPCRLEHSSGPDFRAVLRLTDY